MSLQDILAIDSLNYEDDKKVGVTMDRINAVKPIIRQYIAYWREYPDMFIDFLQTGYNGTIPENSGLHLKAYQRIFLRIAMRYKYVYCVCPRA